MATKKFSSTGGLTTKMVIPFTIQCHKCGHHTSKGNKILALKEEIGIDPSLDVEIYRFRSNCLSCRATFSIVTDPGRYDYVVEAGATLVPRKF